MDKQFNQTIYADILCVYGKTILNFVEELTN